MNLSIQAYALNTVVGGGGRFCRTEALLYKNLWESLDLVNFTGKIECLKINIKFL